MKVKIIFFPYFWLLLLLPLQTHQRGGPHCFFVHLAGNPTPPDSTAVIDNSSWVEKDEATRKLSIRMKKCLLYPVHIVLCVHVCACAHRQFCITQGIDDWQEATVYPFQDDALPFPPPAPIEGLSCAVGSVNLPSSPVPALLHGSV